MDFLDVLKGLMSFLLGSFLFKILLFIFIVKVVNDIGKKRRKNHIHKKANDIDMYIDCSIQADTTRPVILNGKPIYKKTDCAPLMWLNGQPVFEKM